MKILVIGGSGHVSGAVVRAALSKQFQVWTVTRGNRTLNPQAVNLIVDRHDWDQFKQTIEQQKTVWDLVVDCICYEPETMRHNIELFRGRAKQFVFISTDFVYAPEARLFPQPEVGDYVTGGEGSSDYGRKKRECELELINGDIGDMRWTILRPCHIYGPPSQLGCLPTHGRDPELIRKICAGEPLKLVGGGHFLQQPIFVDDLAKTIVSVAGNARAGKETFNTAGPDIIESWQYYRIIADVLGVKTLTIEEISVTDFLKATPGARPFMCHRIYDLSKLRDAGLSVPSTSISDGLRLHVNALLNPAGC
ncbi:MAG: NAD-dependent epimerase/dehydratase family protein [Verrucomicrobia bacterium]|nr:NAD-dependent epimerase/dehydratase family protein [Verrucomicrobiota bacterium]